MASFKNLVTGNILVTDNDETIQLMQNSERYAEVVAEKTATAAAKQTTAKQGK